MEMIREGLHRARDLQTGQLTQVQSELANAVAQMRSTTQEFVGRQTSHNEQFEAKIAELATHTESQISKLRQELGEEFQKGDVSIAEIDGKIVEFVSSSEDKHISMNLEITASFADLARRAPPYSSSSASRKKSTFDPPGPLRDLMTSSAKPLKSTSPPS